MANRPVNDLVRIGCGAVVLVVSFVVWVLFTRVRTCSALLNALIALAGTGILVCMALWTVGFPQFGHDRRYPPLDRADQSKSPPHGRDNGFSWSGYSSAYRLRPLLVPPELPWASEARLSRQAPVPTKGKGTQFEYPAFMPRRKWARRALDGNSVGRPLVLLGGAVFPLRDE
jgi:hypothetical protein